MMLEDLALPWLEEKEERQITTTAHHFDDIRRPAGGVTRASSAWTARSPGVGEVV
jgi:hypothetical protein